MLCYLKSWLFDEFTACYTTLLFSEEWLELLVKVINFLKMRIKTVPLQHVKHQLSFTGTAGSNNWHEHPVICQNHFVHSFEFGKKTTKLDNKAIQIDFPSQLSDKRKTIVKISLIIRTMILTWTKNIIWDRGTDELEQQRHGGLFLLFTSNT